MQHIPTKNEADIPCQSYFLAIAVTCTVMAVAVIPSTVEIMTLNCISQNWFTAFLVEKEKAVCIELMYWVVRQFLSSELIKLNKENYLSYVMA